MVDINEHDAARIGEINDLIINYRGKLTKGPMNEGGGFNIDEDILDTIGSLRVSFKDKDLDIVHIGGNIYGFVVNPGIPDDRKFLFLDKLGNDGTGPQTITDIKNWYTGKYGGNNNDVISFSGIDRRYEGCPGNIDLSLDGMESQFNTLFVDQNEVLAPLFVPKPKDEEEQKKWQKERINVKEKIERSFFTFLFVCSEGAKNSLIHQSLITKLIKDSSIGGGLSNAILRAGILEAARNCGNGEIRYINDYEECKGIMQNFDMIEFIDEATKYDLIPERNQNDDFITVRNQILDDSIRNALRTEINNGRDIPGVVEFRESLNNYLNDNRNNNLYHFRHFNYTFLDGHIKQLRGNNLTQNQRIELDKLDMALKAAHLKGVYLGAIASDCYKHCQCSLKGENVAEEKPIRPDSVLDLLSSWRRIVDDLNRRKRQNNNVNVNNNNVNGNNNNGNGNNNNGNGNNNNGNGNNNNGNGNNNNGNNNGNGKNNSSGSSSKNEKTGSNKNQGKNKKKPASSDFFTNEELGSSPNPDLDNDSTFSPTNNGFESPSPGNSQPLDKGNHDEKASLTMDANIIEVLEMEPNPEVPESSMKNDDPDDLGVKPNLGVSENSTENKLCDTITKKAALFNKNGVTKDDECLALVDKIKKKTAQALTAKAEATNTSVYTPTFKPGGL